MRSFTAIVPLLCAVGLFLLLASCNKKAQHAVVISKEFIPARVLPADGSEPPQQHERAVQHDQWLVHVEMADYRKAQANVDKAQWDTLRVGDKVQASYAQGKYTGTIWSVDLRKE